MRACADALAEIAAQTKATLWPLSRAPGSDRRIGPDLLLGWAGGGAKGVKCSRPAKRGVIKSEEDRGGIPRRSGRRGDAEELRCVSGAAGRGEGGVCMGGWMVCLGRKRRAMRWFSQADNDDCCFEWGRLGDAGCELIFVFGGERPGFTSKLFGRVDFKNIDCIC